MARISPETKVVLPEFLLWELRSPQFRADLIRRVGGSALQEISLTELRKVRTLLPPLLEQKKIAQILSTWDKAISVTEKLLVNSQRQKKALMQQLLTGNKRLLDENGVRFSGEWQSLQISDIGTVVTGSTPPKNDSDNYGGDISWATAEDFVGKYVSNTKIKLSEQGAKKARIVPKGSILVTCIASIGKNAIADENMGTNQQINSVIVRGSNSNEFFYYQIEFNVKTLLTLAGTTAVPIINKSSFEKVSLKFPHFEEQQKIADVLSAADAEITTLQKKLACLKEEKKALMQQLLTGKRRVKVEAEEAVSA
nr:restriction endonuclease subunit S [Escherichia coli]